MVIFPCVTPTGPPSAVLETATPLFIAKTGWLSGMPNISKYIQIYPNTVHTLCFAFHSTGTDGVPPDEYV